MSQHILFSQAFKEVFAECHHQVVDLGYDAEHDDKFNREGRMAQAAICYATWNYDYDNPTTFWPWPREAYNPQSRRSNLVRAAALLVREIERLDRAGDEDA